MDSMKWRSGPMLKRVNRELASDSFASVLVQSLSVVVLIGAALWALM